jgi:hypothetical protein
MTIRPPIMSTVGVALVVGTVHTFPSVAFAVADRAPVVWLLSTIASALCFWVGWLAGRSDENKYACSLVEAALRALPTPEASARAWLTTLRVALHRREAKHTRLDQ